MAFDGFITKSIVNELNNALLDGKINKIFQPNKNNLLISIYSNGVKYLLNICIDASNCRLHLTTKVKGNALVAPSFCMLLRKYLSGNRIKKIYNYDLERVIIFELEGYNDLNDLVNRKLIIELMGKHSNIILTNENDIIIDSIRHVYSNDNNYRTIAPTYIYEFPSNHKLSFIKIASFNDFKKNIEKQNNKLENVLSETFIGFSKTIAQYYINKNNSDLLNIYNDLKNLISSNVICKKLDNKDYVLIIGNPETKLDVNFFIDDFYSTKEENETFINYKNTLLKLLLGNLKKYSKRLDNINLKLKECENMDLYKLYGELITANLYKIKNENLSSITLENYYDNNNLINIPLDKRYFPSINAKKYFKKYNKLKNTLKIVSVQKAETKNELNYIQSIVYSLENAKSINDLNDIYLEISETLINENINNKNSKYRKKENTFENKPIEYIVDNFSVLVGKNNKQNDYLTFKVANKNDIWFHTKDIHGSHVILRTNNSDNISSNLLEKCAEIAAFHSKARKDSKVNVDYTFVKNVKKPKGAKPGMVVFTNYKTLTVKPRIWEENKD